MKKTLYGTTAIVALGLAVVAAAPASAQAPAQGFSSTNFQFTIGGLARGFVGGVSQTQVGGATATANANPTVGSAGSLQSFDVHRDFRLDLTGRATLPNGMVAIAGMQLQPNSGPYTTGTTVAGTGYESQIRRNWVALQSAFGEVRIGSVDNAAVQLSHRSMDAFTAGSTGGGAKTNDFVNSPNIFNTDDVHTTGIRLYDRQSDKITYFSPRIAGFQVGANYTPEASKDRNSGLATSAGGVLQRGYAFGANYVETLSGVAVRASAGYVAWQMPKNSATGAGQNGSDPSAWNFGLGFGYMGFDLGGSYAKYNDVMSQPANGPLRLDATGVAAATNVARFMADMRVFELGLGYTMGPARMSINYYNGESTTVKNADTTVNVAAITNAGKDKRHGYAVSGAYTMGPGVNLEATLFHVRASGPITVAHTSTVQKATGLLTGLILTF